MFIVPFPNYRNHRKKPHTHTTHNFLLIFGEEVRRRKIYLFVSFFILRKTYDFKDNSMEKQVKIYRFLNASLSKVLQSASSVIWDLHMTRTLVNICFLPLVSCTRVCIYYERKKKQNKNGSLWLDDILGARQVCVAPFK